MLMNGSENSVLLVVDVQQDFCPGGSLPVPEGDAIIPLVNRLAARFRRVVATQDWHPRNHVSFASNHPGARPFDTIPGPAGEQILWPDHCIPGTPGARLLPELDTLRFDLILRKGTNPALDSYSAFFENDRKTPTGLHNYLNGLGIDSVYLAGLALDVCVFYSIMDAVKLGFQAVLVSDACRAIDTPKGTLATRLDEMREAGARIVESNELEDA